MPALYADDHAFLSGHTRIIELSGPGDARVLVAPRWQGRVMTSTLGEGSSFGWLNVDMIEGRKRDPRFQNVGGEDRYWMGPEAGNFGLWFKPGDPFDGPHWKTPAGFDVGPFRVTSQGKQSIAMVREFELSNYAGKQFQCAVRRAIRVLAPEDAVELLGAAVPPGVRMVGFASINTLTNAGASAWTREGGLVSIWILGQFKPLPRGRALLPFVPGDAATLGPKATTDYFGAPPAERCRVADDHLQLTCDGQCFCKVGVSPRRARNVLGSYDPDGGTLTIVQFNLPAGAARLPYVNNLWKIHDDQFAGDAVNIYNDGEQPGLPQLGPFYELETLSPAAELAPGQAITHAHRTMHFAGPREQLATLARAALGVNCPTE